jgi:hypothetical protein
MSVSTGLSRKITPEERSTHEPTHHDLCSHTLQKRYTWLKELMQELCGKTSRACFKRVARGQSRLTTAKGDEPHV